MTTVVQQTQSSPLSTISHKGFEAAVSILDDEREIGPRTQLLPIEVCEKVIAKIDADPKCTDSDATDLVALLLRNYPDFKAHDAKGYTLALWHVFKAYPRSIGSRVVDPLKGLPSTLKFTPKSADLVGALDAEVARRKLIRANALSHIAEKKRRQKAEAEEAEFHAKLPSIDERKAQVERLLKRNPLRSFTDPVPVKPRYQSPLDTEEAARRQKERDAEIAAHYDRNFTPDGRPRP